MLEGLLHRQRKRRLPCSSTVVDTQSGLHLLGALQPKGERHARAGARGARVAAVQESHVRPPLCHRLCLGAHPQLWLMKRAMLPQTVASTTSSADSAIR